jgi:hypothetical protein
MKKIKVAETLPNASYTSKKTITKEERGSKSAWGAIWSGYIRDVPHPHRLASGIQGNGQNTTHRTQFKGHKMCKRRTSSSVSFGFLGFLSPAAATAALLQLQ